MNGAVEIIRHPLVAPIFLSLAAGALAYLFSRPSALACRALALAAGALVLLGGAVMLKTPPPEPFVWTWVQLTPTLSLTVELARTSLGMVVVIGSAAFAVLITLYSFRAMAGEYWEGKFYAYLIWALAGACIVGLAGNLLVLLVGWELVTLMLFLMINQGRRNAKAGGAKTYGVLGFADACLLFALALLAAQPGGSANWSLSRGAVSPASTGASGYAIYSLILIAALAKAGAVPLHTWIPAAAEDSPTPVMAYLPAAMDKLLGIYLLSVLSLRMFRPDENMQVVMMVVGGVTIIAAVLMAMIQHNLKKLLSFHAVSQVGYMVLGIGTGTTIGVIGGLFHMVNHAIYKSNLFLMSGTVGRLAGSDEIEEMGGLARALPVTFVCGLIAAASISGIPPFNGFVSKWLVYQGTLASSNHGLAVTLLTIAVFGSALTLASFVKVMHSAFLSPAPAGRTRLHGELRESFWLAAPMVVLAGACVILGLWPQLVVEKVLNVALTGADTAGGNVLSVHGTISTGAMGLWNPTHATVLILIGIVIGLGFVWIARRVGAGIRVVRPFIGGEVAGAGDDRFRVPGTHLYETILKLPVVGSLLRSGQGGAMDPYYWSGKHGHTFVEWLRRQHTGLICLYVAWCVVGLTAALVYLLVAART